MSSPSGWSPSSAKRITSPPSLLLFLTLLLDDDGRDARDAGVAGGLVARHQRLAVRRERHAVADRGLLLAVAELVAEDGLAGVHVPDAQAAAVADAGQPLAVLRQRQAENVVG